ncbi:quinone oxidoreductase [Aspergillus affinis]|uniref:quinone oxidoreductase n=1 Tax=Aspergillus affinis TaxID=1070780 RepID=UPI0022FF0B0F|nr:quinone oxidoreductase [Aspergillus affinis]KAI9035750.1 quinone oxidoreductase [Aspergillus affinis]
MLIDRAKSDTIIDYRNQSDETLKSQITAAAGGLPIHHAYDAVAENGTTTRILGAALTAPGTVAAAWLPKEEEVAPSGIQIGNLMVNSVHADPATQDNTAKDDREFGAVFSGFFGRALAQKSFSGHPFEVRAGGLRAIEGGLKDL